MRRLLSFEEGTFVLLNECDNSATTAVECEMAIRCLSYVT